MIGNILNMLLFRIPCLISEVVYFFSHSPTRRRSKSPSPCPSAKQKSLDLSRSHSFSTRQDHRAFRAVDLIIGEVLGQGFFGQALKVNEFIYIKFVYKCDLHFLSLLSLKHKCLLGCSRNRNLWPSLKKVIFFYFDTDLKTGLFYFKG